MECTGSLFSRGPAAVGDSLERSLSSTLLRWAIVRNAPWEHNVPNLRDRPQELLANRVGQMYRPAFGGVGSMSIRRKAALQAGLLLVAMLANAASLKKSIQITVLDSETRAVNLNDNGVPTNCEQLTFDAYCRSTSTAPLVNTLLVQIGNEAPFRVQCLMDSRFSKCTPLQKGESFEARREKKGVTIYYLDDKGKVRRQFYTLVNDSGKTGPPPTAVAVATPSSAAPAENVGRPISSTPAVISAPVQSSPVQAPMVAASSPAAKVKCDFTSTPPGAEISVDWRYVGNTPSEIGLSAGTHIVVISMPGFAEWKRELTVGSDSQVNVAATLEKAP
jgi:hypothetical protein